MSAISIIAQLILYMIERDYKFSMFGYISNTNEKDQMVLLELSNHKSWLSIIIIFMFTTLTIRIV